MGRRGSEEREVRQSGILMHITSLPGPDGIGSLGQEAYDFADFLHAAGMGIWQVLPMGPTGYGESPYQATSVYAGNPLLISLDQMEKDGLISLAGEERFTPDNAEQVDYGPVRERKMALLRKAFAQSEKKMGDRMVRFQQENPWVKDFALFTALKNYFGGAMWTKWPDQGAKMRRQPALGKYEDELADEIRFHIWCQAVFAMQWQALKAYCNKLGILLFGDMPIYVAEDSADTWTHPEVFQLDKDRVPKRVAGVPPDYFSADGQLWGNPLYRWMWLRFHGYGWWVDRMRHMHQMYDIVRVDHFIGFANYYSIPQGAPNARTGKWVIGPGKALFKTLKKAIPGMDIVAEDLGEVNDRVRRLIAFTGYPGMKVLTFAFGGSEANIHLPGNIPESTAYYTGTHDNQTTRGWADSCPDEEMALAEKVCGFTGRENAVWGLIRTVLGSCARIAVIPMQDVLELGAWATMNHPGTVGGCWLWRMAPGAATPALAEKLKKMNQECDRRNAGT